MTRCGPAQAGAPVGPPGAAADIRDDGEAGALMVSGSLTLHSVAALRERTDALLRSRLEADKTLVLDLAGVARADSAGLALLLHWMRMARACSGGIRLRNVPDQLLAIARSARIDGYLMPDRAPPPDR